MTLSQVFNLTIYYVAIFWAGMVIFPNSNITKKVMSSFLPFIPLSILYIYYLLTTVDPGSLSSAFIPDLSQYANLFSEEGGTLVVTVHFLAMDLFLGRWIYWQGQEKEIWTVHSLILCLFFAPAGLLSHIITAYFFDKNNSDDDHSNLKKDELNEAVS
ncbi:MAG: ABA4-like family protein [Cyanobacteria bacterium J06621_8]